MIKDKSAARPRAGQAEPPLPLSRQQLGEFAIRRGLTQDPTMRRMVAVAEERELGCPHRWLEQHPEVAWSRTRLPEGEQGRYYFDLRVILLDDRLDAETERLVLAHEIAHHLRGDRGSVGGVWDERVEALTDELAESMFGPRPEERCA